MTVFVKMPASLITAASWRPWVIVIKWRYMAKSGDTVISVTKENRVIKEVREVMEEGLRITGGILKTEYLS